MVDAVDHDDDLVQMPLVIWLWSIAPDTACEMRPKPVDPKPYCLAAALPSCCERLPARQGRGTVIGDPVWREGRERRPFRASGEGWEARRMAVIGLAASPAHALAVDLARRAAIMTRASAKLRTRDGGGGLALILADDCVAPWRMAKGSGDHKGGQRKEGLGSDRAARRFCESLDAIGALRLLTDRPAFRLYRL
jgi:hypothetical protein